MKVRNVNSLFGFALLLGILYASPAVADNDSAPTVEMETFCHQVMEMRDYSPMNEDNALQACIAPFLSNHSGPLVAIYLACLGTERRKILEKFGRRDREKGIAAMLASDKICEGRVGGKKAVKSIMSAFGDTFKRSPAARWRKRP